MKLVVLSADGDGRVYLVPDEAADNLEEYCMEFCGKWLWTSPHAAKYRKGGGVCYNEADFIEYLNQWIFPEEPSVLVESIPWDSPDDVPVQYQSCPRFNF